MKNFLRLGIGPGRILYQPGGIQPDVSGADALMALISNNNNYAVALGNITLSGASVALTGTLALAGVTRLLGSGGGAITVTLPITPRLIDALGPTVPIDGAFAVPFSIQNEDAANTATLVAGDSSTTLNGTMTVPPDTRRIWLLTLTSKTMVSIQNIGTFPVTGTGTGSGTVTSVGLTMPVEFAVGGSPVTTAGTLAVTKAVENANTVWAGPTSGGAAIPTFRILGVSDLPAQPYVVAAIWNGVSTASLRLIDHCFGGTLTYTLVANAVGSVCKSRLAVAAQSDWDLQKNGGSIGTIRFAIGAGPVTASYVGVGLTTFTGGTDDVRVVGPATPDTTAGNFTFNLYFSRSQT